MPLLKIEVGWKFNLRSYVLIKRYYFGIKRSTGVKGQDLNKLPPVKTPI
jgi:hypothetical protein